MDTFQQPRAYGSQVFLENIMPCYLLTFHGYGTWLPDRERGYVKRSVGVLAQDLEMSVNYRRKQDQTTIDFDESVQTELIGGILHACSCIEVRCHSVATDQTHVHLLVSWKTERTFESICRAIKTSLTRRLNEKYGNRLWFSKGSSHKCVTDRSHFEYLTRSYLPRHRGICWQEKTCDS